MTDRNAGILVAAALALTGTVALPGFRTKTEPPERPCLNCGKPKSHNNSFCSADCCRAHRGTSR